MLKLEETYHEIPNEIPGYLRIYVNFIDDELINRKEKEYLETNSLDYTNEFIRKGYGMEYEVENIFENNPFKIEFLLEHEIHSTIFLGLYKEHLKTIKNLIRITYTPYYLELRKKFNTQK